MAAKVSTHCLVAMIDWALAMFAPLVVSADSYSLATGDSASFTDADTHTYDSVAVAGDLSIGSNTKFISTGAVSLSGGTVTIDGSSSVFGKNQSDGSITVTYSPAVAASTHAEAVQSYSARLRGPIPILSAPYHQDGSLDLETLVEEARFVAGCGVNGFIWAQSNDAIDLLTIDERKESFAALAKAFEGSETIVALGCQGRDTADMEALARHVEFLAGEHPSVKLAIVSRPPHDARTQDDIERYYRALAQIARRPVIIQTYTSDKVPVPDSALLVRLAHEFPSVYGWIKEESGGADTKVRMLAETSAPEVKTVFSAWGSYGWLDQYRRFGTRGVISERAGYADVMMYIWRALEKGSRREADNAFALYLFMLNVRETIPGAHMRGFNLYVLKKRGIFKNYISRDYADETKTPGKWKLDECVFSLEDGAEIERRLEYLKPFFVADQKK